METTEHELRRQVAQHYSDAFRLFGQRGGEGIHDEGDGWHRIITRKSHFIANMAIVHTAARLEPLQDAIAPLVNPGFPSAVCFLAEKVPTDSDKFLVGNGFEHVGGMPLMAVEIDSILRTGLPDDVEFGPVEPDEVDAWAVAMDEGYGLPPGLGAMCASAAADGTAELFAARSGGRILSTSMLFLHDGLAGIYCVATRPEARGKGLGAYVTSEPLRMARKKGYKTGILQSSEAGYPVYKRIGFRDVGSIPIYIRHANPGLGPS